MAAKITIGPNPYHWPAATKLDFYRRMAEEPAIDEIYLGEVICSKRAPYFDDHLPDVTANLMAAGKTVILSSLAEVMLPRERKATSDLAALDDIELECNNAAALYARGRRPHRIGPFMNAYNETTIAFMADQGATHICLPSELPAPSIAIAAAAARARGLGVEVQVFGRASLAVSARCYHARAHRRTRDNCQFVCEDDADGMPLTTQNGTPFLRVNGIQTQSESYIDLLAELDTLENAGITHFRLSPQMVDMAGVARVYRARAARAIGLKDAGQQLRALCGATPFSNGFYHGVAGYRSVPDHAAG